MRIAVLGDIHGNLDALQCVLEAIDREPVDRIIHTGDVVGYGTEFARCIDILRERGIDGVCGNHDLMALGRLSVDGATPEAARAIEWTQARLGERERRFLETLPRELQIGEMIVFHATPDSYVRRIVREGGARRAASQLVERHPGWWLGVHGHVHRQQVFEGDGAEMRLVHAGTGALSLDRRRHYILCPGSVGVSRDTDPRSAYMLLDTSGGLEMRRIEYPWRQVERKIREAGLSTELVRRPHRVLTRKLRQRIDRVRKRVFG